MTREASMRTRIDAAEPPEVRTADACTQHADHGFILAFYLRDRHFIIDLDTSWFYKYSCFHLLSPSYRHSCRNKCILSYLKV